MESLISWDSSTSLGFQIAHSPGHHMLIRSLHACSYCRKSSWQALQWPVVWLGSSCLPHFPLWRKRWPWTIHSPPGPLGCTFQGMARCGLYSRDQTDSGDVLDHVSKLLSSQSQGTSCYPQATLCPPRPGSIHIWVRALCGTQTDHLFLTCDWPP